jgi:integrating conjugative element protein (TIGR03757 family)
MALRLAAALVGLASLAGAPAAAAAPDLYDGVKTVEVFANMAMLVTPATSSRYRLAIYRLDAMQNVEAIVNRGLPQKEAAARKWVADNEARLRRQVKPLITSAVNGMALAQRYRIDRLPAVVFNQRFVVFGYADVDQALAALLASRRRGAP